MSKKEWKFYHYTDAEGLEGILESGRIKQSNPRQGDAYHGKGVYGNWMNPNKYSKNEVAENNYAQAGRSQERRGKTDYCIETRVPRDNLTRVAEDGRGILVHKGDVNLHNRDFKVHEVRK